jgi:hypothetical protein
MIKFTSVDPVFGLRHVRLGTMPPGAECLGEAIVEDRTGAILRTQDGRYIFQYGTEHSELDRVDVLSAFIAAENLYHEEIIRQISNLRYQFEKDPVACRCEDDHFTACEEVDL